MMGFNMVMIARHNPHLVQWVQRTYHNFRTKCEKIQKSIKQTLFNYKNKRKTNNVD